MAKKTSPESHKPTGIRRKGIKAIISMTVVPFLLLSGIELGLRIAGYGHPTGYFIKKRDGQAYLSNPRFGQRFFPPRLVRYPFLNSIPQEKPPDSYRIFILGGSAAKGEPDYSFGFARILGKMLSHAYPHIKFEICNTAMVAINSHVVYEIARDCKKLEPDLFIIYLGNNEVVGPFGAGTVFQSFAPSLAMIRTSLKIKSLRIGQLLDSFIQSLFSTEHKDRVWLGMEMFLENQISLEDPNLRKVYSHFERNLDGIINSGRDAGAEVIVCTVATNLKDCAPFASMHRPELSETQKTDWGKCYENGSKLALEGNCREAVGWFLRAIQIDNNPANLHFQLAQCYLGLNQVLKARDHFRKARDRDTLRFRADTQINNIIRGSPKHNNSEGIHLVDVESFFEKSERTFQKTPGEEYFYEHVHLNFPGNYLLATAVFQKIHEILPEDVPPPFSGEKASLLSMDECASLLAFTMWDLHKISGRIFDRVKRPPFTNQIEHNLRITKIQEILRRLRNILTPNNLDRIQQVYQAALEADPEDWILHNNLAEFSRERGEYQKAIDHWRFVLAAIPNFADANNNLGALLVYEGKIDEAIPYFHHALRMNPNLVEAHINLGVVLDKTGKKKEAAKHFSEALRLNPGHEKASLYLKHSDK